MKITQFKYETNGNDVVKTFSNNVDGRTFLITGPSPGGIGSETVISLATANPKLLILAGRSESKISPLIQTIQETNPKVNVLFIQVDLGSQASVREAAQVITSKVDKIDVIINNAAIMVPPYSKSVDGIESQFATNHIGHFLLTNLLLPKVLAAGRGSRIVNVSSSASYFGGVRFDDYNFKDGETYSRWLGYAQSKTANVLFARSLADKLKEKGILAFSLNPGSISTGLQQHMGEDVLAEALALASKVQGFKIEENKTLQQGCSTTLVAALDPALENYSGAFLNNCDIEDRGAQTPSVEDAVRLWELSEKLVGQRFD